MDPTKIIDNLLTVLTLKEVTNYNLHIDEAQKRLSGHQWVLDALSYLESSANQGHGITLAHSEWIDRVFHNSKCSRPGKAPSADQ